ncbi:MAG: HAD family phosphatase [Prevotella sp.]|nr:HAD family phosphatase [Prevotella sp.]
MIKTIAFDLGGVVVTIDQPRAVNRFKEIGLADAEQRLDPYTQMGIFGDLEHGLITAEDFRVELGKLIGHEVTVEQCAYAWQGYAKDVPMRNLEVLKQLRQEGYRVVLLSNTNPYMMMWAMTPAFDGQGHSLADYFDHCYLSFQLKMMKPSEEIFRQVLKEEQALPEEVLFVDDGPRNVAAASQLGIRTFCPKNGADWTEEIYEYLGV